MPADKIQGELGKHIVGIPPPLAAGVCIQNHFFFVAPQVRRIVGVRSPLVEVSEPFVEALPGRHTVGVRLGKTPLTGNAGGVPGLPEHFGDCDIFGFKRDASLRRAVIRNKNAADFAHVVSHACVACVLSGHQDASRRSADGRAGVALSESRSLICELINVRSKYFLLAVAT